MGPITLGIGLLVFSGGGLWLLVLAFAESILWGMGSLLLWPAVTVAFGATYWPRTRLPLILHFSGFVVALIGGVLWGKDRLQGYF